MANAHETGRLPSRFHMLAISTTLILSLVAISLGYGLFYDFECRAVFPTGLCQGLSLAVPRAICAIALLGLVLLVRPSIRDELATALRRHLPIAPFLTMIAGLTAILVPLAYHSVTGLVLAPGLTLFFWLSGLCAAGIGLFFAIFEPAILGSKEGRNALSIAALAVLVGLVIPEVALLFQGAWAIEALTDVTFRSVESTLTALGYDVVAISADKTIEVVGVFGVAVGRQWSGVEGFALISVFTLAYIALFRHELRLGRALLILPVALVLSWCLNALRISVLIILGVHVSPELAVNGFHSHAGWLAFVTLAFLVAFTAHSVPWFRRLPEDPNLSIRSVAGQGEAAPPFFADRNVVLILPFAVFMASSTVASAFFVVPGLYYPLRILAVGVVLYLGRAILRRMDWTLDWLAILAGAGCGILWLLTAPPPSEVDNGLSSALATLSSGAFVFWVIARVLGTAVFVPVLEEFVFRGYLQDRIAKITNPASPTWPWVGLLVSSVLFGLLHDRVIAGALAGLLFGLLYQRRNRLSDAIFAHAAANTVIAAAAMMNGSWHLI